jgi:hypothetical protein
MVQAVTLTLVVRACVRKEAMKRSYKLLKDWARMSRNILMFMEHIMKRD